MAGVQFMAWDTASRRKIDLIGREDDGDQVVAHEFDYSIRNQLIYSRNGVNITATPVDHYATGGPVALRLDWYGISITYSGEHLILYRVVLVPKARRPLLSVCYSKICQALM